MPAINKYAKHHIEFAGKPCGKLILRISIWIIINKAEVAL